MAAGSQHAPRIAELAADVTPGAWTEAAFSEQLGRTGNRSWLAQRPGEPETIGFLVGEEIAGELHVLNVGVKGVWRRRGLGRTLVQRALQDASAAGLDVVHLEVRASNRAAHALYEREGFQIVGLRPRYYRDQDDAVLMSLSLTGGAGVGDRP